MTLPTDKSAGLPGDSSGLLALARAAGLTSRIEHLIEVGSTQDWLLARPAVDLQAGDTVVADFQSAGRGRGERSWSAPSGSGLMMSTVALLPADDPRAGLLPVIAGVAVARAVRSWLPGAALKWPNDLVMPAPNPLKLGGLVVARHPDSEMVAAVIGVGVNIQLPVADRPTEIARALSDFSAEPPSRDELAVRVLAEIQTHLALPPAEVLASYRSLCLTLGQMVRVLPVGRPPVMGLAADVTDSGAIVLVAADGQEEFSAADVEHLRAT